MGDLISVSVADKLLRENVALTPSVRCPIGKTAGRVLREEIFADRDLPPFDRCMLDGYAVRAEEAQTGSVFKIASRLHAGESSQPLPEAPLSAIEVMTGSMLPKGANTVIAYEETETIEPQQFRFVSKDPLENGDAVHRQACDYPKGTSLLPTGTKLGPVEIGILASCGYATPLCSQQPRIAIFGTGDELVPVDSIPGPHQIRESNLYAIENALSLAGFSASMVTRLSDDKAEAETLAQALEEHEVVILSGAVSKGKRDWIPSALDSLSQKIFHGVSQRPGKPMGFWKQAKGPAIFGLPGNPVSTLVATHRYVIPYLNATIGYIEPPRLRLKLSEPFNFSFPKTLFLPVTIDDSGMARSLSINNSGDYARLARSSGFLELNNSTTENAFPYIPWQL